MPRDLFSKFNPGSMQASFRFFYFLGLSLLALFTGNQINNQINSPF